jgi:hypothetical protein
VIPLILSLLTSSSTMHARVLIVSLLTFVLAARGASDKEVSLQHVYALTMLFVTFLYRVIAAHLPQKGLTTRTHRASGHTQSKTRKPFQPSSVM